MPGRLPPIGEDALKAWIMDLARLCHWRVVHFRQARVKDRDGRETWRTPFEGHPGFPDLVLARDGVVIIAELKSDKGTMGPGQRDWGLSLGGHYRLWRPKDRERIREELQQPRGKP